MMPQSQTVVVIDDDVEIRTLIELALGKPGRTVVSFSGGDEAAAFILSHPRVDCIVSDIRMAGLDGYGLLERIERDARARGTPVIFVSADDAAPERVTVVGADVDHLRKPFEISELRARVDAGVERRSAPLKDFPQFVADALARARAGALSVAVLVVAADGDGAARGRLAALARSCLRRSDVAADLAPYACAVLLTGVLPDRAQELGRSIADRLRTDSLSIGMNPRVGVAVADDGSHVTADGLLEAAREAVSAHEAFAAGYGFRRATR